MLESLKLPDPPHKARILIAIGMQRSAIVICTDSEWVENEADAINANCYDIGILDADDYKNDPGLYLWEGTLKVVGRGSYDGWEEETDYTGKLRPVDLYEIGDLLAMRPPCEHLEVDTEAQP